MEIKDEFTGKLNKLILLWTTQGIKLNPGVSLDDIKRFESDLAFSFEKEKLGKLVWLIPQRFAYRQIMYVVLFKAMSKAIKGESQGWGALKRTGSVKQMPMPAA